MKTRLLVISLCLMRIIISNATEILDQSFTPPVGGAADINEGFRYVAQTFTAGFNGTLAGINVAIHDVSPPSPFHLHIAIHSTTEGKPSAAVLGETTLSSSSVSISYLITFPEEIPMEAGRQYAIVVDYPGAPPPGPGQVQGIWDIASGYVGGNMWSAPSSGDWTTSLPDFDGLFRTFVSVPDSLPERAAELAKSVVGGEYLFGGKGWDWLQRRFVDAASVKQGYNYCRIFSKCGDTRLSQDCDITLGRGLDCSGLIFWAYNNSAGATEYRRTRNPVYYENANAQFNYNSDPINDSDLKTGDLLFFNYQRLPGYEADHVAMYVGGNVANNVVEALNCSVGIKFSSKDTLKNYQSFVGFRRLRPANVDMQVRAHSPVNLTLTDPDGMRITSESFLVTEREVLREVPGVLYYSESDIDDDGFSETIISVPNIKPGAYLIGVAPKAQASPRDTYSLDVAFGDAVITLAQNVQADEIPESGYGIQASPTGVVPFVPVKIEVKPGSDRHPFNLKSTGIIPVAILSTPTFDAPALNIFLLKLGRGNAIPLRGHSEDINGDGRSDLVLFFKTQEIGLTENDTNVVLTGEATNGALIRGVGAVSIVP